MIRTVRLFLLVVLAATAFWPAPAARAADRPNILWLTCEDMSPDLGCYGDTYATTPAIDALAARGIRYTRAFAEAPMCAPSRSALITGMHTGPLGTSQMRSTHPVPAAFRGFPAWLKDAGYYTTNNAKTDYNLAAPRFKEAAWDESSSKAHWRKRPPGKPFFSVFNCVASHQGPSSRDDYELFVKNVQSRLAPGEIHDPAAAPLPPSYPDSPVARRTVARAYDCITVVDGFVRDKLAELEADGLVDDTIVFFFSDHGAGMPGGKAAAFARGLRVPLLVHVPEKFRHLAPAANGTVTDRLVSFVDFGPTVLRLAGVPVPGHMQGTPFLGTDVPEPAAFVHGIRDRLDETLETTRWISDGRHLLVRSYDTRPPADQQTLLSFFNGNGELCREIRALKAAGRLTPVQRQLWGDSRPPVMLFDIEADPWCVHDLAGDPAHADRVQAMLATLESGMLRDLDLGFWPEPDRVAAEQGHSAHLRARQGGRYPLDCILPVARLVGQGPQHRPAFLAALADPDASVRYWAAVGLAALGDDPAPLRPLLADPSPSVRIVAAEALVRHADDPAGLDLLAAELDSRNEWAATRAARALELLGEKARPKLDVMRDALRRRTSGFFGEAGPDPVNYGLEFALTTAIRALEARAVPAEDDIVVAKGHAFRMQQLFGMPEHVPQEVLRQMHQPVMVHPGHRGDSEVRTGRTIGAGGQVVAEYARSDKQASYTDDRGTVVIRKEGDGQVVTVTDPAGTELYSGPYATAADLEKIPENYREWVDAAGKAVEVLVPEGEKVRVRIPPRPPM